MRRWCVGLGLLALLVLTCPWGQGAASVAWANGDVALDRWVQTTIADFSGGTFTGVVVDPAGDGELRLLGHRSQGTYTSAMQPLPFPGQAVALLYKARVPSGARLVFELRARAEAGDWSSWMTVPAGLWTDGAGRVVGESLLAFPAGAWALQYRVTFYGRGNGPALEEVTIVYMHGGQDPAVQAVPPWHQDNYIPIPLSPEVWGGQVADVVPSSETSGTLRVQIVPAALTLQEGTDSGALLRMAQRFYQEVVGLDDLPYTFLVDAYGGVYGGRPGPIGDVLYIGLLGGHPQEQVSPTVEDALVALLPVLAERWSLTQISAPAPLLVERLLSRWQAGNLRQDEWFLAQGATGEKLHEWILLSNPSPERVQLTAELHLEGGSVRRQTIRLAPETRGSLFVNQSVVEGSVWAELESHDDVLLERALYYGHDGDVCVGLDALSREWYLPGGTQEAGFSTTLTLLNPGDAVVTATVTAFAPGGPAGVEHVQLAPRTRLDLPISRFYSESTPVGCRVTATRPIAVEQAVRFSAAAGGYALEGSPVLSRRWTVAAVETAEPFVTVLALLNPLPRTVPLTLTLMSEDGTTLRRQYTLRPGEQRLNLNTILPELALAAEVVSAQPIAVARITFFNDLSAAHAALGAVRPARHWYLAEGSTADPFETFLIVANPNGVPTELVTRFMGGDGPLGEFGFRMPAYSRLTVSMNDVLPDLSGFSALVESNLPVVVERSMYLHQKQGGHASLGIPR